MDIEELMGGGISEPAPMPSFGGGGKRKRRKGALNRPGDSIRPSEILNHIGWTIWGFSWLATTNALRFLTFAVLSFLLALFGIELPELAVNLLALAAGGWAAWAIQIRITALERPFFVGHFSVSAGVALILDLALNYSGVKFAAPVISQVFSYNMGYFSMGLGAIGLTALAELFMVWAIIERKKGY